MVAVRAGDLGRPFDLLDEAHGQLAAAIDAAGSGGTGAPEPDIYGEDEPEPKLDDSGPGDAPSDRDRTAGIEDSRGPSTVKPAKAPAERLAPRPPAAIDAEEDLVA